MQLNKIITLASVVLLLNACGGSEDRQAKYLERAQEYFAADNIEKAKIEIKNVMQINPNNIEARYLLGEMAEKEQNFRAAYSNFNAILQIDPNHVPSLNKLSVYMRLGGDFDGAKEQAEKALSIEPENADALAALAAVYIKQDNFTEAEKYAQKALANEPGNVDAIAALTNIYSKDDPELALKLIGDGLARQSQTEALKMLKLQVLGSEDRRDEVIAVYKELVAEHPDNLLYSFRLVNYLLNDDRYESEQRKDNAERFLRDLIEGNPDKTEIKLWLVEFLNKNRGIEAGEQVLAGYVKAYPDNFSFRDNLAAIYLQQKRTDDFKKLYQEVINKDPSSVDAIESRNRLVSFFLSGGDRPQAEALLAEVFQLDAENEAALITRAKLSLTDKNVTAAIPDLRIVIKNNPESKQALSLIALAHLQGGSVDLALDNYQRLLAIDPKNVEALVNVGRIFVNKNDSAKAISVLESALAVQPDNAGAVQALTSLYLKDNRLDDALSITAKLLENDKTMGLGHYLQGRIYMTMQDAGKAVAALEKSLAMEPTAIEPLSALMQLYASKDGIQKSITYLKAHIEKYPALASAKELLANIYASNNDSAAAIAIYEKLLAEEPARVSAYIGLGRLMIAKGDMAGVEKLYMDGLKKNPESQQMYLSLAEIYMAQQKNADAIGTFENILSKWPDSIVAKNNLASLLMDYSDFQANQEKIVDLAQDLAQTENPAFLDTAGWVQYKLGNYPQAVALLAAAVDKGGNAPVFHYHLGMAYFKSDLKAQARESLTKALENPEAKFVGREEAEQTLATL